MGADGTAVYFPNPPLSQQPHTSGGHSSVVDAEARDDVEGLRTQSFEAAPKPLSMSQVGDSDGEYAHSLGHETKPPREQLAETTTRPQTALEAEQQQQHVSEVGSVSEAYSEALSDLVFDPTIEQTGHSKGVATPGDEVQVRDASRQPPLEAPDRDGEMSALPTNIDVGIAGDSVRCKAGTRLSIACSGRSLCPCILLLSVKS